MVFKIYSRILKSLYAAYNTHYKRKNEKRLKVKE